MWYDKKDKLQDIVRDIRLDDNPQRLSVPDSIREDGKRELRDRGYSESQIRKWENA